MSSGAFSPAASPTARRPSGNARSSRAREASAASSAREPLRILGLIEQQLRDGLARGAVVEDLGAFRLFRHARPGSLYSDMALPRLPDADWPAELRSLARQVGRLPAIELTAERWPGLVEALEDAAGTLIERLPLMVLDHPPEESGPRRGASLALLDAHLSTTVLDAYLRCLDRVQGGLGELHEGEVESMAEALADGWVQELVEGDVAAPVGGARLQGRPPVAELAAVWTDPRYRRQGRARNRCALLLQDFFARGGELVWLGAATAAARDLYATLGFTVVGSHVSWRPAPP